MIPVRMGSKRVKNKNIRLLGEKPLVRHIIDAAKNSKYLTEIYLNSESVDFETIAIDAGINFYKRPLKFASDDATNDEFAEDFIKNNPCDILIQLLATSPFVTSEDIDGFISKMLNEKLDTLISVSSIQIEALYDNKPINFEQNKPTPPSQNLIPIKAYACSLMGWNTKTFLNNLSKYGAAYHGGDGSKGFYELSGYSTIDIDHEEDFQLSEVVYESLNSAPKKPRYFSHKENKIADADRERILNEDGVTRNILNSFNKEIVHVGEIIQTHGRDSSWSYTLVNSPSTCSTLIAQMPGEGNRMHYHPDWDEWWFIIEGEWEWMIEGQPKRVKQGDLVFIERNRKHKITAVGSQIAIRMAVSRADVDHIYDSKDY